MVDRYKLPKLSLGSVGPEVRAAKMGINKYFYGAPKNTYRVYGPFFLPWVKRFKAAEKCGDRGRTGYIGDPVWAALIPYIPAEGLKLLPQKRSWRDVGPVVPGGPSLLDHDLTHATSGIPLYPAFDTAFSAGRQIIAPEGVTIWKKLSSSNPGMAFYAMGDSGIDYWFGHLDRRHPLGTRFAKGQLLGRVIDTDVGGGPHAHVGVNVERLLGTGEELVHHKNYTHGAPTIRRQLLTWDL